MKPELKPTVLKFPGAAAASLERVRTLMQAEKLRKRWQLLSLITLIGFWLNLGVAIVAFGTDNWTKFGWAVLWIIGCVAGGVYCQLQVRKLNTLLDA